LKTFLYSSCAINCRWSQQICPVRSVNSLTFPSRIRKWEDVTVDEVDVILTVLMLMGIVHRSVLKEPTIIHSIFFSFLRRCLWKNWSWQSNYIFDDSNHMSLLLHPTFCQFSLIYILIPSVSKICFSIFLSFVQVFRSVFFFQIF
jgi:hypothetical protein